MAAKQRPEVRRRRARLVWSYVEISVPTLPEVIINVGDWQVVVAPTFWRRGRFSYPPTWRERPDVFKWGPIRRTWALGPLHLHHFPLNSKKLSAMDDNPRRSNA
jgi:hypothetical protein